jgi:hypothetical protein
MKRRVTISGSSLLSQRLIPASLHWSLEAGWRLWRRLLSLQRESDRRILCFITLRRNSKPKRPPPGECQISRDLFEQDSSLKQRELR